MHYFDNQTTIKQEGSQENRLIKELRGFKFWKENLQGLFCYQDSTFSGFGNGYCQQFLYPDLLIRKYPWWTYSSVERHTYVVRWGRDQDRHGSGGRKNPGGPAENGQ